MCQHRRRPSHPRGFTVVELVVAMMLVAVGLLSLVGASSILIKRRNETRQRLAAVAAAANRVAEVSSGACRSSSGTANTAGIAEHWSATLRGNATREIVDSVHFGARPAHDVVIRTWLPC